MRSQYDEQLEQLNNELIVMGAMCEEAIAASIQAALDSSDLTENEDEIQRNMISLKKKVEELEVSIDHQEREIENLCMRLLIRQQPVAKDLRVISSALKMISDMERIGDQAADIAELAVYIKNSRARHKVHIKQMAKETIKMVTDSVDSFVKKDVKAAQAVVLYDDVVDKLFEQVKSELIELISQDSEYGEMYVDLLMIAKYFERIGDHATNIAEWVEYSVTGSHGEKN